MEGILYNVIRIEIVLLLSWKVNIEVVVVNMERDQFFSFFRRARTRMSHNYYCFPTQHCQAWTIVLYSKYIFVLVRKNSCCTGCLRKTDPPEGIQFTMHAFHPITKTPPCDNLWWLVRFRLAIFIILLLKVYSEQTHPKDGKDLPTIFPIY